MLLIQTQWSIVLQYNISIILYPQTPFCNNCCTDSRNGACGSDYGVPINQLNRCVQCDKDQWVGLVMFILIQVLPVTAVVLIIIVFNIQLTNGFMIGLVFYCQMISIVYPNLNLNVIFEMYNEYDNKYCLPYQNHYVIPANIFNLNFLMFVVKPLFITSNTTLLQASYINIFNLNFLMFVVKPLFITSNTTLLQAISFWYIIPIYPLVLLFWIHTWITMYDKGFRCVVTITRPLHRLLARF